MEISAGRGGGEDGGGRGKDMRGKDMRGKGGGWGFLGRQRWGQYRGQQSPEGGGGGGGGGRLTARLATTG